MPTRQPDPSLEQLIRRYTEELQSYHRRHQPPKDAVDTLAMPDFRQDLAAMRAIATPAADDAAPLKAETAPESDAISEPTFPYTDEDLDGQVPFPAEPTTPAEGESPHVGYLRVYVFGAAGAEPLTGARVAISRTQGDSDTLFANLTTNRDGFTPVVSLPTVDPALSLTPGNAAPYIAYNIQVSAEGFTPALYDNVPIYGNTYVTQPAALTPLIPGGDGSPQIYRSGGPENLQ